MYIFILYSTPFFLIVTTMSFPIPNLSNIFNMLCNFFEKIIPLGKENLGGRRPISLANKNIEEYEKVNELVNSKLCFF